MGMFRYHKVRLTQTVITGGGTPCRTRKTMTIIKTTQKMRDWSTQGKHPSHSGSFIQKLGSVLENYSKSIAGPFFCPSWIFFLCTLSLNYSQAYNVNRRMCLFPYNMTDCAYCSCLFTKQKKIVMKICIYD